MQLVGIPNDMIQALNCIACIGNPVTSPPNISLPLSNEAKKPFRSHRPRHGGFHLHRCTLAYEVGIQSLVYGRGPCYDMPLACPSSHDGRTLNIRNMSMRTPKCLILSLAAIPGFVSTNEYTYSKAP